ncbi:hypothetical protein [Flagellimonas crocea]|uniref:hypothetical protein n=1 Tax=Flagellimonas crocea TaxID=3067311 RepID=UPI00296EBD7F|nr:hypothetical protein [Muricauda sp. DH64]
MLSAFMGLNAQVRHKEAIKVEIGFGMSSPYNSSDEIVDTGLFLQGTYVVRMASWFDVCPYAGVILTKSKGRDVHDDPTDEKATSSAILVGGKGRVKAPIPWVAPYIELGVGVSVGRFETFTYFTDIEKKGLVYHIPFSLGFELGRNHGVDIGLSYYYQPTVEQYAGALAIGLSIPINVRNQ